MKADNLTEVPKAQKSDRAVVYVLLIALVKNVLRNLANHCFVMK